MNRRILIIDDQEAIHEDFRLILAPDGESAEELALDSALSQLGINGAEQHSRPHYELSFAAQGRDGLALVQAANEQGKPFAVAFVDVRMPPGWDGVETLAAIAAIDSQIQFVAMTAFSDRDRRQMIDAVGDASRLLFLKKPFAAEEIEQLALALSERWNLRRAERERTQLMEGALDLLRTASAAEPLGVDAVGKAVLHSLVALSGASAGAIVRDDEIWVRTPSYDTAGIRDHEPAAAAYDFTDVPGGIAMRLTDNDVLMLAAPSQIERLPDLLHLCASAFAAVLRAARHHEQCVASEREAAMGRALAEVSHDFKGRIFSMLGFAELLEHGTNDERARYTRRIGSIAREMKSYIDDLLEFAHTRRVLRVQRTDMPAMAQRVAADHPAGMVAVQAPDELFAEVDELKLERALRNVVANAVEKAPLEAPGYRVAITLAQAGGALEIEVQDNGREVDPAVREDLFKPLVSHGKAGGTGLGLSIARDFVARHGGELSLAESRPGCNRFVIRIPDSVVGAAA